MSDTDTALVRRARDGDRPAFEELVRRSSRLVFARLYLETGSVHRAEDLLQETLLLAFRSLRKLTDPAGFRPWLLALSIVFLGVGFWQQRRARLCAVKRSYLSTVLLWTAVVFVVAIVVFPQQIAGFIADHFSGAAR